MRMRQKLEALLARRLGSGRALPSRSPRGSALRRRKASSPERRRPRAPRRCPVVLSCAVSRASRRKGVIQRSLRWGSVSRSTREAPFKRTYPPQRTSSTARPTTTDRRWPISSKRCIGRTRLESGTRGPSSGKAAATPRPRDVLAPQRPEEPASVCSPIDSASAFDQPRGAGVRAPPIAKGQHLRHSAPMRHRAPAFQPGDICHIPLRSASSGRASRPNPVRVLTAARPPGLLPFLTNAAAPRAQFARCSRKSAISLVAVAAHLAPFRRWEAHGSPGLSRKTLPVVVSSKIASPCRRAASAPAIAATRLAKRLRGPIVLEQRARAASARSFRRTRSVKPACELAQHGRDQQGNVSGLSRNESIRGHTKQRQSEPRDHSLLKVPFRDHPIEVAWCRQDHAVRAAHGRVPSHRQKLRVPAGYAGSAIAPSMEVPDLVEE